MKYHRSLTGIAILAASMALSACGSSDAETVQGGAEEAAKVIELTDQPGSVEDYVGALEDVEVETCSAGGGGLDVAGSVTNPVSDTQDYRIYVSAMSANDTEGLVQVDIPDVSGGDTVEWSTHMKLPQEALECVLRVERFPAE